MNRRTAAIIPLVIHALAALSPHAAAQDLKIIHIVSDQKAIRSNTRAYRTTFVWLPRNYSKTNKYPVVFTFGRDDSKLVADVANYYTEARHELPPVIVVGMDASVDEIGFQYDTGKVNVAGRQFANYFADQLTPCLERSFSLAPFRTYIGHSYCATYTDYILAEHPKWFDGLALIAPEQPGYAFDYRTATKNVHRPFFYFLASGGQDIERRQRHAASINHQLSSVADPDFHFRFEPSPSADHLTSVPRAVPAALEFLFSGFKDFNYRETDGDLAKWFEALQSRITATFGFGILKDSLNAGYFGQLATERKDPKSLAMFESFFDTPSSDASIHFNFAQGSLRLGDYSNAEKMFSRAITRARQTHQADFLLMSYRTLALRINSEHNNNPAAAWKTLEAGFHDTSDVVFKYFFGMISAKHGYRIDDGIRLLNEFSDQRDQSSWGSFWTQDKIAVLLGKCFLKKGDRADAMKYVEKAMSLDPANEDAIALKKQIEGQ